MFGRNYNAKPAPADDGISWNSFYTKRNSLSSFAMSILPSDVVQRGNLTSSSDNIL